MSPYHYAIWMAASVPRELPAAAEAGGADVDAVAGLADGVRALYPDGVGEIAAAAVAFDLETGLGDGWRRGVSGGASSEGGAGILWISSGGWGSLFRWVMVIG
jgi:hypothetical protein